MTQKERILAVLKRQEVDKIPFAPRIDLWYNCHKKKGTLPKEYQNCSIWDILREVGGVVWNKNGKFYLKKMKNLKIKICFHDELAQRQVFPQYAETLLGDYVSLENTPISFIHDSKIGKQETLIKYTTPVGEVSTKFIHSPLLLEVDIAPYQREYLIKKVADYKVAEYIVENTELVPNYNDILRVQEQIGEEGIVSGRSGYCPMHQIMRYYLGYEKFCYELYDHPKKIEHFLEILTEKDREIMRLAAESPTEFVRSGGNWDSYIISPSFFRKYFAPYFREFSEVLHSKCKILGAHTDGEMKGLLQVFLNSGIDVAEAFTPYPMTDCTLSKARKVWQDKVIIWGGIPTTILSRGTSDRKFEDYMRNLFKEISPRNNFILGMGDNTPIDAKFERLFQIKEMIDIYGEI